MTEGVKKQEQIQQNKNGKGQESIGDTKLDTFLFQIGKHTKMLETAKKEINTKKEEKTITLKT